MRLCGQFISAILLTFALTGTAEAGLLTLGSKTLKEQMVPHKALYDIEMVSKSSGSQILNISGQMFYEWRLGCEAWTTDHRFNLFYEYADSPPIRITSDFSTYETYDGSSFDFTSRRKRNGELYQEIRGRAEMSPGQGGEALYSIPEGISYDLKPDALFPMAHSLEILRLAQEGKKFYSATVFDGSDEDGPVEINAFIGKKISINKDVKNTPEIDPALINTPAWKVRMAFFPLGEVSTDAEYEMDVNFHENGVISDMLVEYRDFSVTQKLTALEKLESEKCGPRQTKAP